MKKNWLLYGANGYTGELIVAEALRRGHRPILAGRNEEKIAPLAKKLGLEQRTFSLTDAEKLKANLSDITAVLLAAGPYSKTARPMVEACLAAGAHYLDITGEHPIFELVLRRRMEAAKQGLVFVTGVGFDVVPTDCLANILKKRLPDAIELELAFGGFGESSGSFSRGTMKTMLEYMSAGSMVRIEGRLQSVPYTWRTPVIDFPQGPRKTVTVPWGDITTAFHSTGIPNISEYMIASPKRFKTMEWLKPLLRNRTIVRALQQIVQWTVVGPGEESRKKGKVSVWGRVRNAKGDAVTATMTLPEGYTFTAQAAVRSVEFVLAGKASPGAWTPAQAFGELFIKQFEEVTIGC